MSIRAFVYSRAVRAFHEWLCSWTAGEYIYLDVVERPGDTTVPELCDLRSACRGRSVVSYVNK